MSLWIDVTTAASCPPPLVGIARVESNLAEQLCRLGRGVRTCVYEAGAGRFSELDASEFLRLMALNRSAGKARGTVELDVQRHDRTASGGAEIFDPGDAIVACGFSWLPPFGNMGRLYALRNAMGLRVIGTCYDIIPLKFPHWVSGMDVAFRPYLRDMVRHADHVLCISRWTQHDLCAWIDERGERMPAMSVMPMGCEFEAPADAGISERVAHLLERPFLLCVGTIEERKNHRVLCRAYASLMAAGVRDLPTMVFVGGLGEGGPDLVAEVAADERLASVVLFLSGVSDHELTALYDACLFTLYPSLYEGWGLPVSESLGRGKLCLASDRASLPEAGEEFADYADAEDVEAWAHKIAHYLTHGAGLEARERAIRERFRPKRWVDAAEHVLAVAAGLAARKSG